MIRASTLSESLPPLVEASPTVAAAVEAYLSAGDKADDLEQSEGCTATWQTAVQDEGRAWVALEDLLLAQPRAWHLHKGIAWGVQKRSKRGFELVRRDPGTIKQAPSKPPKE
jgi:hypothetical protein